MKRRMIWIFLAGALVGIVLSGLYKHFVTDQIMDGGNGMENPDQNLFLLDGDGTYVDNSLLWPVLEGTWESPEDGWQAVISEEDGLTLRLDGETVLETPLDFTYIPRKKIQDTGLMLDNRVLQKADGTEWGKILDVYHCAGAGEDSGRLELTVDWSEAADKVVELQKVEELERIADFLANTVPGRGSHGRGQDPGSGWTMQCEPLRRLKTTGGSYYGIV